MIKYNYTGRAAHTRQTRTAVNVLWGDTVFSELKNICDETGLSFSDERTALFGEMRGFGVTVAETAECYDVRFFCERPFEREQEIFPMMNELAGGLPKNTMMRQTCEVGYVGVLLDKFGLMQENIVYLVEFLDKLAVRLEEMGLERKPYSFPRISKAADKAAGKDEVRVKLGFDRRSILGLVGALIGAAAMTVIAILIVNIKGEIDAFGLAFEVSTYILSAATVFVVFADYRFLARKLDAAGVIACPVLSVLSVVLAGMGAGVKTCAQLAGVPFMQALRNYPEYLAAAPEVDKFVAGYITRGLVLAVVASILFCIFYFERHPDETILTEKVRSAKTDGIDSPFEGMKLPFGKDDR